MNFNRSKRVGWKVPCYVYVVILYKNDGKCDVKMYIKLLEREIKNVNTNAIVLYISWTEKSICCYFFPKMMKSNWV